MFSRVSSLLFVLATVFAQSCNATGSVQSCASQLDGKLPSTLPYNFTFSGNVRRYYIAAEEVEWNYAPTGWDNWLGVPLNVSPKAMSYIQYNTTYLKALYRGYTDASFTTLSDVPVTQGIQGPTMRAEVGDMIEILFYNKLSRNYATMHSMGLAYNKMSEGGDYPGQFAPGQNTSIPTEDAVPPMNMDRGTGPGDCAVYKWLVTPEAGPSYGPARAHSYHSYVDMAIDLNSGLMGPSIIYAPGQMNKTMSSYKEFPILYMNFDESMSFLSVDNAMKLTPNNVTGMGINTETLWSGNYSIWHPQAVNYNSSMFFSSAPTFNTINGYFFANNPTFEMSYGDNVIWYSYAYGAESHVFHMHGNSFVVDGVRSFSQSLNDGVSKTLYMQAQNMGLWQVICHVDDHHMGGMVATYRVHNSTDNSTIY